MIISSGFNNIIYHDFKSKRFRYAIHNSGVGFSLKKATLGNQSDSLKEVNQISVLLSKPFKWFYFFVIIDKLSISVSIWDITFR